MVLMIDDGGKLQHEASFALLHYVSNISWESWLFLLLCSVPIWYVFSICQFSDWYIHKPGNQPSGGAQLSRQVN